MDIKFLTEELSDIRDIIVSLEFSKYGLEYRLDRARNSVLKDRYDELLKELKWE